MPPTITATDHPLEKLTGDAVVVAVGKGPDGLLPTPGAEAVDRLLGGRLLPALADLGARGAEDEVTRLPSFGQGPFPVVAVAGLGAPDAAGAYRTEARAPRRRCRQPRAGRPPLGGQPARRRRRHAGRRAAARRRRGLAARRLRVHRLQVRPAGRPPGAAERVHRSSSRAPPPPRPRCAGCGPWPTPSRWCATWSTPRPTTSTPPSWPPAAPPPARRPGSTAEILDEDALAAGGYGGILAVGSGSTRKPRLLRLTYSGSRRPQEDRAGRQGHHLRQRRPLDQARAEDGGHEERHGRRRRRDRHRVPRRPARPAGRGDRDRARSPRTCPAAPPTARPTW